jgi:hypothetical protein
MSSTMMTTMFGFEAAPAAATNAEQRPIRSVVRIRCMLVIKGSNRANGKA